MMALEPPFAGRCDSYAAVVSAVLHAPPVDVPSGYSQELSESLQNLLARKPHNRPSNRELLRSPLLRDAWTGPARIFCVPPEIRSKKQELYKKFECPRLFINPNSEFNLLPALAPKELLHSYIRDFNCKVLPAQQIIIPISTEKYPVKILPVLWPIAYTYSI